MTKRADQLHQDKAPAHFTALAQALLAKHHITQVCQHPTAQIWLPATCGFSPKSKIAVESEGICECKGHTIHYLSQWRLTAT